MKSILKPIFFFIIIIFIGTTLLAQAPDTLWTNIIKDYYAYCVNQTSDGGFITYAGIDMIDSTKYRLVHFNSVGDTIWTNKISRNRYSFVREINNGGFILSGRDMGFIEWGCVLSKIDSWGNEEWCQTPLNWWGSITSAGQGQDSNIYYAFFPVSYGFGDPAGYLGKCTEQGDSLELNPLYLSPLSIQITNNNEFISTGVIHRFYDDRNLVQIMKVGSNGDSLWNKCLYEDSDGSGCQIIETTNNSFIIMAKSFFEYMISDDILLIKTDENGDTLWTHKYGDNNIREEGNYVIQTSDGGYVIVGTKTPDNENSDIWLIKTDERGDVIWEKTFGGDENDYGLCVQQTDDNGYLIVGNSESYGGIWFIRLEPDLSNIDESQTLRPSAYSLSQNYPNPFNPSTTIEFTLPKSEFTELKVYNILGKEVSTIVSKKMNQGKHTYTFDGKSLASGIYYYQLVAGDYREVKKMILIK